MGQDRNTPNWVIALFICIASLLAPNIGGASLLADTRSKLEIEVTPLMESVTGPLVPIHVSVKNRGTPRQLDIRISTHCDDYRGPGALAETTRQVFAPNGMSQWEILALRYCESALLSVAIWVDGTYRRNLEVQNIGLGRQELPGVVPIGDDLEPLSDELDSRTPSAAFTLEEVVPISLAPSHWQAYVGLHGIVAIDEMSLNKLSFSQRNALSEWVSWGGGVLWIHGKNWVNTLSLMDLQPPVDPLMQEVSIFPKGLGTVVGSFPKQLYEVSDEKMHQLVSQSQSVAASFTASQLEQYHPLWEEYGSVLEGGRTVFEGIHDIPRGIYCAIAVLLALLIGPLNFIVLSKKKRLSLIYITAPILAVSGMVLLFVFSVLYDGLGVKANERIMLVHDQHINQGAVFHTRAIFAGIAPRDGLSYSDGDVVVPFWGGPYRSAISDHASLSDWTNGQLLQRGFVSSRKVQGLYTVSKSKVRMGVWVKTDSNGNLVLTNGLTATLKTVLAKSKNGNDDIMIAKNVAPGETVKMTPLKSYDLADKPNTGVSYTESSVGLQKFMFTKDVPSFSKRMLNGTNWSVFAETGGLPHVKDGGLNHEIEDGRYYYLGI